MCPLYVRQLTHPATPDRHMLETPQKVPRHPSSGFFLQTDTELFFKPFFSSAPMDRPYYLHDPDQCPSSLGFFRSPSTATELHQRFFLPSSFKRIACRSSNLPRLRKKTFCSRGRFFLFIFLWNLFSTTPPGPLLRIPPTVLSFVGGQNFFQPQSPFGRI